MNPDLIFASESIANMCKKSVMNPIRHTQHRPICVSVQPVVVPPPTPFCRRFNFRKADWNGYSTELDNSIEDVEPIPSNYNRFVYNVRMVSRRHIPRGCRTDYFQRLTDESKNLYEAYKQQYSSNPFDNRTMESGNLLLDKMTEEKRKIWEEVITSTNMTHNSRKAWKTINKHSNDPTSSNPPCLVTANQVAHQLLVNGRGTLPSKPKRPVLPPATEGNTSTCYPFSEGEYNKGVAALKNNKTADRDDILVEQLKHLGPKAHKWLLTMLNICFMDNKIPYSQLCRIIQNLLSDRRFYVELNNERSRWIIQKIGLPQGSVLPPPLPILFNTYTNDQPILDGTRSFIYADDLCVTAQYPTFQEVEQQIEEALKELTHYYRSNSLRANPDKTQVTAFHLRNREAERSLQVSWNGEDLENTDTPKVLRCNTGQDVELQDTHTQHQDEGSNPKQPTKEISKF